MNRTVPAYEEVINSLVPEARLMPLVLPRRIALKDAAGLQELVAGSAWVGRATGLIPSTCSTLGESPFQHRNALHNFGVNGASGCFVMLGVVR